LGYFKEKNGWRHFYDDDGNLRYKKPVGKNKKKKVESEHKKLSNRKREVKIDPLKRMADLDPVLLTDDKGRIIYCPRSWIREANWDGEPVLLIAQTEHHLERARTEDYNSVIAETFCSRVAMGENFLEVCAEKGMPTRRTVHKWINEHPEFEEMFYRARMQSSDTMASKILQIVEDEGLVTDADIKRAQLKVGAYKWSAERLNPDRYGPTQKVKNEGAPEIVVVNTGISRSEPAVIEAKVIASEIKSS
jgi:hypothetical protein